METNPSQTRWLWSSGRRRLKRATDLNWTEDSNVCTDLWGQKHQNLFLHSITFMEWGGKQHIQVLTLTRRTSENCLILE